MNNHQPKPSIEMQRVNSSLGLSNIALETVLNFLPYPFLVSEWRDGNQQNLFVNNKFVEEIGYTCADIPTITDWFRKAYPDEAYRHRMETAWERVQAEARAEGNDSVIVQAHIQTPKRGRQWYEVKASISGPLNLVAFVNINEEVTNERKLEQLNDDKNRILSILSHDLRAPLNNLHGLIHLATEGQVSTDEYTHYLHKIGATTFSLIEFLDTTLQWTKANFDGIHPTHSRINLPELITKVCYLHEKSCIEKGIAMQFDFRAAHVVADAEIVSIVLRNILSNAIKFTPAGTISIATTADHGDTIITIRDAGIGMSEAAIASVFNGQAKSMNGTRQEKGFGLGLRLCRDLLQKIGGQLQIASQPGQGTTVGVRFSHIGKAY